MNKWIKIIIAPLGFLVFVGALALLHNELKNLSYAEIMSTLSAIPSLRITAALCLALSYYILLGGYDIIAFKYINAQAPLKLKDILFTCFVSNVLGSNTGYSMLFGGSIRYRLYSIHNVSMVDVTKVLFFSSATIWLGLLTVGGLVFTIAPVSLAGITKFSISTRWIGLFFLAILTFYVLFSLRRSKPLKIFKWRVSFPNIKIVSAQIILATCDWLIASLTLFMLMPSGEFTYFVMLKVFLVSQLLGIISQVPGGMGVFETAIVFLLPTAAENPAVMGGLLAYRAIFYFFPLSIALAMLAGYEIMRATKKIDEKTRIFGKNVSSVIVQALAVSAFFSGMFAIFSASTPFDMEQLKKAIELLPAWLLDLSHFLLGAAAAGMLFLSRGLLLRIKNARKWALIFLGATIFLSLIVGEPPLLIAGFAILFAALFLSKKYFYRDIPILNTAFSPWWFAAVGGVFVLASWIGFFANRQNIFEWIHYDVFFSNLLSASDTARFLRAVTGIFVIFIIVAAEQIFRNFFKKPVVFTNDDIKTIVNSSDYAYSFDALAGDKKFFVNADKDAFIMYAVSGDSWIALGDPVGKFGQRSELLWKFKELTDKESVKPAFIGIDRKNIQFYDDIGLDVFNIGQEAKIPLRTFGGDKESMAYFEELSGRVEAQGFKYSVVMAEEFESYKEAFAAINGEWRKKSDYISRKFLPGRYNANYMKDMDFGVLKKDGKICAFSPLAAARSRFEISSGIVRHSGCGADVFEYLVFKNVMHAKENGFKWFDLGLSYIPSEDSDDEVIKRFAKMFMFAEHFGYNLPKLREFKNKFRPVWHEKYVAVHPDKYIVMFLKNFTALISPEKEENKRMFFRRFMIK